MSIARHTVSACFNGPVGEKFLSVYYQPHSTPKAHIVYIPPLGEEMNRCRALVATQARQFADAGYSCTVIDLFGTGDSEGELHQASLKQWYDNIELIIRSLLQQQDKPVHLWGLRLGGLLALDFCAHSPVRVENIVLWQPVSSSKRFVTQLLRQRVASLVSRGLVAETTKEMRLRLKAGENIEISGYIFGEKLLADIEAISFADIGTLCSGNIEWFEHSSEAGQELGASAKKMTESLVAQGNKVEILEFFDPPLWQLHKRDHAPQLIERTGKLYP